MKKFSPPILSYFFLLLIVMVITVVCIAGFRGSKFTQPPIEIFPDMDRQPKFKSQAPSAFFADARADRLPVEGTIPFEVVVEEEYLTTGKMKDQWGDGIPVIVTSALLARGRERYEINCRVCHGGTGAGNGITKQFGLVTVSSLLDERIRVMADGEIFNTITHGKNTMGAYPHIKIEDRWAIIAYLRALQLSQAAPLNQIPDKYRKNLPN